MIWSDQPFLESSSTIWTNLIQYVVNAIFTKRTFKRTNHGLFTFVRK